MIFPIERDSQRSAIGAALVFVLLPTLAVCLRVIAGRLAHRSIDASDYCVIAACILNVAVGSMSVALVVRCGIGYHASDIIANYGHGPITTIFKLLVPLQIFWALSLSFCKISVLILYAKLITAPSFVLAARFTAVFLVLWALATVLTSFLVCRPFEDTWDQAIENGNCGNRHLAFTITGAFNALTDLLVILLPVSHVYKLKLPTCEKFVLSAVFVAGLLTCAVSAMRIYETANIDFDDLPYTATHAIILTGLEPTAAILLACAPLLRPLVARLRGETYSATLTARFGRAAGHHKPSKSDLTNTVGTGASPGAGGGRTLHNNGLEVKHTFELLGDNSSQWKLRPDGPENTIEIAASGVSHRSPDAESDGSVMPMVHMNRNRRFINVSRDWTVTSSVAS